MVVFLLLLFLVYSFFAFGFRNFCVLLISCIPMFVWLIFSKYKDYQAQKYLDWLIEQGKKDKEETEGGVLDADNQ